MTEIKLRIKDVLIIKLKKPMRIFLNLFMYNNFMVRKKYVSAYMRMGKKVNKKGYSVVLSKSNKLTGISDKKRDNLYSALAPGKRESKKGNVYYEYRKNRADLPGKLKGK